MPSHQKAGALPKPVLPSSQDALFWPARSGAPHANSRPRPPLQVVGRTCAAPNDLYLGKLYCVKNNFRTCDCPYGKTCPPPPPGSRGNQWCQPV